MVVGAGMAGIVAAEQLRSAGTTSGSSKRGNGWAAGSTRGAAGPAPPLDLGASWIHGYAAGNPITPIARRAGARLVPSSYDSGQVHIDPRLRAAGVRPHLGRWARIVAEAERAARPAPARRVVGARQYAGGSPTSA